MQITKTLSYRPPSSSRSVPRRLSRVLVASLSATLVLAGCGTGESQVPQFAEVAEASDGALEVEGSHGLAADTLAEFLDGAESVTTEVYPLEPVPESAEPFADDPILDPNIKALPPVTQPVPSQEFGEDGPLGAIAAVNYLLELRAFAYDSGDTAALDQLSSPDCEVCRGWIDHAQQIHAAGGHLRFGESIVTDGPDVGVDLVNEEFAGIRWVFIEDEPGVTQMVADDGTVLQEYEGGESRTQQVTVTRESGEWVVLGYEAVERN